MAEEDNLSLAEQAQLQTLLGYGSQIPEGKENIFSFFKHVATANDTTKLGNLKEEEVGIPKYPLRTYKTGHVLADEITDYPELGGVMKAKGEILTSTSLSKEALLIRLAVTQKKELADVTKVAKKNGGWFKRKEPQPDQAA